MSEIRDVGVVFCRACGDFASRQCCSFDSIKGKKPNNLEPAGLAPTTSIAPTMNTRFALYLLLLASGLAGNYFTYPIFLEVEFLFGSIFTFLAVQFFGKARGIFAGVLIAGVTYYNWGHPYAVIIMAAEVALVAGLTGRYKISLVTADALYWLFVGMPLVYFFYHGVMDVTLSTTTVSMTKQAVNGITNALAARMVYMAVGMSTERYKVSLREILHTSLVFCVLAPMLLAIVIDSRNDFLKIENDIRASLARESQSARQRLASWLQDRFNTLNYLATLANARTPGRMQVPLEQARATDLHFVGVGLMSKTLVTTAYSPAQSDLGRSNIGVDFSDRPFVAEIKNTLKPMLSEVVAGRLGKPRSIVALLQPVITDGQFNGLVSGVLDQDYVEEYILKGFEPGVALYTLIDKAGQVILTNRKDQKEMTPFVRGGGNLTRLDEQVSQWTPHLPPGVPFYVRFTRSSYVSEMPVGALTEWRLVLEQPMAPVQARLSEVYTGRLALLLVFLILGILVAELICRQIARTSEKLRDLTIDLPAKLAAGQHVAWPVSRMLETDNLVGNFQAMADSLKAQFVEKRQLNAMLEHRVRERTEALAQLNSDFVALLDNTTDFIDFKDAHRRWRFCSQPFAAIAGKTSWRELVGKTSLEIFPSLTASVYGADDDMIFETGQPVLDKTAPFVNAQGQPGWISVNKWPLFSVDGAVIGVFGISRDITQQKAAENKSKHLAFYDHLTQLPNRRLLIDRMQQALTAAARSHRHGALLFLDLDNFKNLNDSVGHHMGDLLLQQVGQRLLTCVREGDTVARIGGDEFVVMLEGLSEHQDEAITQARLVGEKVLTSLSQVYSLDGHDHFSTPSIGATLFCRDQDTVDELLKRADLAMYQAKGVGKNSLRFFDPVMQLKVNAKALLESDLREGIAGNQLVLHYQVQVVEGGRLTGAEVLVRWQHPVRGLVYPMDFIPLAEETKLIIPLGHWVLEAACAQLAIWAKSAETAHLILAVNVSARQFQLPDFVQQVLGILDRSGANPNRLKLEITESMLLNDMDVVIAKMAELKAQGIGFSLDDFGTGYSSLSYLKRMPLDQLKIDRSFINEICTSANDAAIAEAIIGMGQALGLTVIAEGVETEAQSALLLRLGCTQCQGYYFGRPVPIDEFEVRLSPQSMV